MAPPPPQLDSVYVPRAKKRSSTLSAKSNYEADKERRTKVEPVEGRRIYGDARGWRTRERTVSFVVLDMICDFTRVEDGERKRERGTWSGRGADARR